MIRMKGEDYRMICTVRGMSENWRWKMCRLQIEVVGKGKKNDGKILKGLKK